MTRVNSGAKFINIMAKVLIIDDDEQLQQLVGGFLSRHGYEVEAASNGSQGLIKAATFSPDLILCDLDMPELDGQAVVSSLRANEELAEIPVLFLSACADRKQIRQSMNLGGDDFITKPAELMEILETINARMARLGQQRRRKAKQFDQAANVVAGIINNLGHSESDIKWWSEAGKSKFDAPAQIIQRVRQIIKKQKRAYKRKLPAQVPKGLLLIKDENIRRYLKLSEVKAFVAKGEYSAVCWGQNRQVYFRKPLKQWELELPAKEFVRVHREAIVNLAFLDYVKKDECGNQHIHIHGLRRVIKVSQRAKSAFNQSLKNYNQ